MPVPLYPCSTCKEFSGVATGTLTGGGLTTVVTPTYHAGAVTSLGASPSAPIHTGAGARVGGSLAVVAGAAVLGMVLV